MSVHLFDVPAVGFLGAIFRNEADCACRLATPTEVAGMPDQPGPSWGLRRLKPAATPATHLPARVGAGVAGVAAPPRRPTQHTPGTAPNQARLPGFAATVSENRDVAERRAECARIRVVL